MCMNLFKICVCMCGVSSCDSKLLLMVLVGSTCNIAALLNCLDHLQLINHSKARAYKKREGMQQLASKN